MVTNNIRQNILPIIHPLTEEGFWNLNNLSIEVDYVEGLLSEGDININDFAVEKTKNIIEFLVLSITKGEYILPETLSFLKEFSQHLNTIKQNALYFEQDNLGFENKFFQDNFILPLNFCITNYISLIVHLNNIFNLENTEYLFEFNSDEEENIYIKNETKEEILKWIQLFSNNIIAVRIENQLNLNDDEYSVLLKLSTELNNNDYDSVFKNILKQKCDFLRYKWVVRRKKTGSTVRLLKDGSFIEPKFEDSTNVFIKKWKEDIDYHYSDGESSNDRFRVIYNSLKRKEKKDLTLYELHQLIKYTKDFKKDYSALCEYVEEVKNRERILNNNIYNRYIFTKDLNYVLNNKFSFLVDSEKCNLDKINTLYKEIKDFQEKEEINNFFINYKYLRFLVKEIKKINISSPEDYIGITEKYFTLGEEIIDSYKSDIEWSQKNLIFLYCFEYDYSIVKINDIPVFLQSNFQLPLSPTKYLKEFNEVKKEFLKLKGKYDVFEKIGPQVKKVKELEKRDIRDLERLSLFTAVISFIVGGVSGFSFIKDVYTALLFFVIFSTSLVSFLIILYIFTRGHKILKKQNIILIILLYILFGGSLYMIKENFKSDYYNRIETLEKDLLKLKTTPQKQGGKTQLKNQ